MTSRIPLAGWCVAAALAAVLVETVLFVWVPVIRMGFSDTGVAEDAGIAHAGILFAAAGLGGVTLARVVRMGRVGVRGLLTDVRRYAAARFYVYAAFGAIVLTSVAAATGVVLPEPHAEKVFALTMLAALHNIWAVVVLLRPKVFASDRVMFHVADLASWSAIITVVLVELCVLVWAKWWPTPLVFDDDSVVSRIAASRGQPGKPHFNFLLNSGGYNDREFFEAREDDLVVACLADSFGFGVVPYDYNFLTIAESRLAEDLADRHDRIALHNFGVTNSGVPEYRHLLLTQVEHYRPRMILVCLFVGNDVKGFRRVHREPFTLQRWLAWRVFDRSITASASVAKAPHRLEIGRAGVPGSDAPPAWVQDIALEPPVWAEDQWLAIESRQAEVLNTENPETRKHYAAFFEGLAHLRAATDLPMVFALLPTQAQVDDTLYAKVMSRKNEPRAYDRDLPQERILAYCTEHSIPVLDLLPAFRDHVRRGGQRTYRRHDIHWNTIGNRIAGEQLARFLQEQLR